MNVNDLYPSAYLKAADFPVPRVLTIAGITLEEIGEEKTRKPCIAFLQEQRKFVLNKQNAMMVAQLLGEETDHWVGKNVELYKDHVSFGGRMVEAIRVRPAPLAGQSPHQRTQPPQQPTAHTLSRQTPGPSSGVVYGDGAPAASQGSGADYVPGADDGEFNDDIPV